MHAAAAPGRRPGRRVTPFALAALALVVPFALLLDQVVRDGPFVRLDETVANDLHGWVVDGPGTVRVLKAVTNLADPLFLTVVVAVTALVMLWRRRFLVAAFLVVTPLAGSGLNTAVKTLVDRDRPSFPDPVETAGGQSFTSGHSFSSTVVYGALLLVLLPFVPPRLRRWAVAAGVVLVLAVGFTRIALGVHFLSDVIGGYCLGLAFLLVCAVGFRVRPVEPRA